MAFGEVGTSLSKVKANSLNLAGTFGFSGTISGLGDETPLVLIQESSISAGTATVSFTSGIDSTYKEYLFIYNNIHPATNGEVDFSFQADTGTNTNYNQTITSTSFRTYHTESDSTAGTDYRTAMDQAQGTSFQKLIDDVGGDNDQSTSGMLRIYNPSSTTFVKHFMAMSNVSGESDISQSWFIAGYFNTTSALTRFQFKLVDAGGNMDDGTIQLFGVV
jgi:hypothetical protein|tara:strand:- start:314 stop:970 length:657 start_codon:yes stop_codon:yes gene_type:complete